MAAEQWERRQGMRARDGWVWSTWQLCDEAEARRVDGLQSWQVRRVCVCETCGGTGRMPVDTDASTAGQPFFAAKDIALATMTPVQEAAAQQGWCMQCAQSSLSEKHREGGTRWLQCSRCTTVYALGVAGLSGNTDRTHTPPSSREGE